MAKKDKPLIKLNKKTGCKEFKNYFHFVGQVKPVRKKENDDLYDVPYFNEKLTETKKPRRVLTFNVETALSNELKTELNGMEMENAYAYSSKHNKAVAIPWANRLNKETFPDNTYNILGGTDWDNAEEFAKKIEAGKWIEVKGYYEFSEFTTDEGTDMIITKRMINSIDEVVDGQVIQVGKDKITYVYDLKSPDFIEVNRFNLQIGIRSTFKNEKTDDTHVNAVVLTYGKEKSKVENAELVVYQKETEDGKMSLADAFNTLEEGDFIEVIGTDNNRAVITYVDVVEEFDNGDPFADVDDKTVRQERVVSGDKKGLEILSFVTGTKILELLTKEEMTNNFSTTSENPFPTADEQQKAPVSKDPFAD